MRCKMMQIVDQGPFFPPENGHLQLNCGGYRAVSLPSWRSIKGSFFAVSKNIPFAFSKIILFSLTEIHSSRLHTEVSFIPYNTVDKCSCQGYVPTPYS